MCNVAYSAVNKVKIASDLTIFCDFARYYDRFAGVLHFDNFSALVKCVNRYKKYIPIVAAILVLFGVNLDRLGIDLDALSRGATTSALQGQPGTGNDNNTRQSHPNTRQWSSTNPEINLWHVFEGEINRSGKPTGYHSRPGGVDAANARLVSIKDKPNRVGIYTATVEVRDGDRWKSKFSSFFPDSMSQQDVIDAVLHAFNKSNKQQKWEGPSGLGFNIQGYTTNRGGINTAFPVYLSNQ